MVIGISGIIISLILTFINVIEVIRVKQGFYLNYPIRVFGKTIRLFRWRCYLFIFCEWSFFMFVIYKFMVFPTMP